MALHSYAAVAAEQGGWTWRKPGTLRPGEVQFFAGRRLIVRSTDVRKCAVVVAYEDHEAMSWPAQTEVAIVDA